MPLSDPQDVASLRTPSPLKSWCRRALLAASFALALGCAAPTSVQAAVTATTIEQVQDTVPASVARARRDVASINLPDLNPFAFTAASQVWASQGKAPQTQNVRISSPNGFAKDVTVAMNLSHGPQAPMLVIVPGAFASHNDDNVHVLERLALDKGMNFVALDNPLNARLQKQGPKHFPGNPVEESRIIFEQLQQLQGQFPQYFDQVSITGYSYGGLLAVGVVEAQQTYLADHPEQKPIINGSVAAVSPPENLLESMNTLDSLHNVVGQSRKGSGIATALHYRHYLRKHDFNEISPEKLQRSPGGRAERHLIDKYGFRSGFESMVVATDRAQGVDRLPLNQAMAQSPKPDEETQMELASQQREVVKGMGYKQYMQDFLSLDPYYQQHQTTPEQVVSGYHYKDLLKSASLAGIPVMTLVSDDDFILNQNELNTFRQLQEHPASNEVTAVLKHGGHTGIYYSPEVRNALGDFLSTAR